MIRTFIAMAVASLVVVADAAAQAQGTTGRGAAPAPKRPAVTAKTTSARVLVKDPDGAGISGVRLILSGAATGEFTTGAMGTAIVPDLKDGMYRVRCERDGFITLEREFTLHGATWNPIDIVLAPAPPPPPPPPPPAPVAPPAPEMAPGGPAITVSIPDFVDHNYIGREPMKESIIACKPLETVRLLQMREPVARHVHERLDEVVYVVAGEGAVKVGDESVALRPGSLIVLPHGSGHAFERRGKNPLVVLSTLVGSACEQTKAAP
jgi:mannose-6-phosphate isomerase-like protein (cupin superfamily)